MEKDSKKHIQKLKQSIEARDKALISQTLQATVFFRSMAIVPDIVAAAIADNFSVQEKDGKIQVVALNAKGEAIWSAKNPGEKATVEEAAQILAESKCKHLLMPPGAERPTEGSPGTAQNATAGDHTGLLDQYHQAKENNDTMGMVALKRQMVEQGIRAPL